MADAMASNGMKEAGYQYINIDDTWEAGRDAQRKYHHQYEISGHRKPVADTCTPKVSRSQ